MSKSERVKDIFDNKIGKISKREIEKIYPDISIITIEKEVATLLINRYIKKVGSGRATAYIKNDDL